MKKTTLLLLPLILAITSCNANENMYAKPPKTNGEIQYIEFEVAGEQFREFTTPSGTRCVQAIIYNNIQCTFLPSYLQYKPTGE